MSLVMSVAIVMRHTAVAMTLRLVKCILDVLLILQVALKRTLSARLGEVLMRRSLFTHMEIGHVNGLRFQSA